MLTIRVPQLSSKNQNVTVLRWHRRVGEVIGKGVILVDLQLDHDLFSLSSPKSGIVERIVVAAGQKVAAKDIIALIKDSLPVFDPEAELVGQSAYSVPDQELTISSQVALQQRLADLGSRYANRVQSLPPKWQTALQEMNENEQNSQAKIDNDNNLKTHPLLAAKCWRKEEHRHPSDLSQEQLDQAELRYDLNYQPKPSHAPTPRPY